MPTSYGYFQRKVNNITNFAHIMHLKVILNQLRLWPKNLL